MQGGENHLQRGFVFEFGVRVDRDAAAVVAHGEDVAGLQRHFDAAGMASDGFVHGVVEDFGGEVVQGGLVRAADVHAGAAADGLQALKNLNVLGAVAVFTGAAFE